MPELRIGALPPSGADATEHLKQLALADADFPLRVHAVNRFPFRALFLRSGRFHLEPSGHAGSEGEHVFERLKDLERFVKDVQAVASMRKVTEGVVLSWTAAKAAAEPEPDAEPESKATSRASSRRPSKAKTDA